MAKASLSADCERCAALCCVGLAFDRSPAFALDKPAGLPCPYLSEHERCAIHRERPERGFAGCVRYDCYGAGQRVTQEIFGGRSWRADARLAADVFEAFRRMRLVHELLLLLDAAGRLPLSAEQAERQRELETALEPAQGWSCDALERFENGPLPSDVRRFLVSLRGLVSSGALSRAR